MKITDFATSASGFLVPGSTTPSGLIVAPSKSLITDLSGVDLAALGLKH